MKSVKEQLRWQHEVPGINQPQFPYKGNSDRGSEPGPGDERDASEPVPDVWHLSIGFMTDYNPEVLPALWN